MTLHRDGTTLILSGEVVRRDLDAVQAEFAQPPAITHVVLRNSMGGNSWTGYRLGELFRGKGVTTVVSGHCVSSCSRLFLGGRQRLFSDDYPASLTYVGFHGHYDFGKLNIAAVEKNDLLQWTLKFTDGKADPALVKRWIAIERRAGDVRFYPPAAASRFGQATVLCQGNESVRPQQCEKIATHALAQGIVTAQTLWSSPDASHLLYGARRVQYPTSAFATLDQADRLPVRNAVARRDFALFKQAALPRAFAVSANGLHWAWAANDPNSVDVALARCRSNGGGRTTGAKCVLYAVDERVVYAGQTGTPGATRHLKSLP
ncbi:MAG: hypothetical protein JNL19_15590 [Burkholderiales bacterium]|nr:hypothetical protein [Burkholderiales bacterium]